MRCGHCGASLGEGYRFCGNCGAAAGGCPSCGEPLTAGERFCHSCGRPLGEAAGPAVTFVPGAAQPAAQHQVAQPPAAQQQVTQQQVAERRVCSVLFCDMVGFTPLSEARDPEAVRELLSRYFGVARTVVGRYGGVVEKFIGDAIMAVWGTPAATEEDPERAVRAGLDVLAAVTELGSQAGLPGLAARAGVVTGEVAVTLGAVGEGMVAGDAVNTASRVQVAAQPGQVLTDETTHRLTSSAIGFADAGIHQLKGKAEPQQLWRATRVLSAVGGSQRVDGLEAPLTGRDAELRTIRELFHAAAERRVPRLVLVAGPAGVGKSRLGWEFEKYADGLAADMWWHRGRCLSYGEGVAFWGLAEIVRQRLGIAEDDPADVASAKLAAGLDRFVPDPAERDYIGVRLSRLLGVGFRREGEPGRDTEPGLSREELFAGWRLFFERLATIQPVVLVLEDAQYADSGLLDFLDHLVDWVRDLPVYVLVLARPELSQARPGFGTGRNRSTLTLDPLDALSMDVLVDALVPGMPPDVRGKITGQAQGIPLFAVETVRALIDRDIVQPAEGVYRLAGDVGELAVPDSLHALLAARLDALAPAARRLVADAAVLGTSFPAEALIAVSDLEVEAVRSNLADLVRREVLSVSADPLSPERGSYQFAQHMLRQVAYDTLSRKDRKVRHLKVAAHLRTTFAGDGEEVTDVIARHYLDALHAVPDDPDAAQITERAISALVRAAERAERTGAPGRAVDSFADAARLSAPEGGAEAAALWERAAQAATVDASWAVAIDCAGQARDLYLNAGDARAAARVQAITGHALFRWGRMTEGRSQFSMALEVLAGEPDLDTVHALEQLALLEVFDGSPDSGRLSAEALTLGEVLDADAGQLARLFLTRGICLSVAEQRAQAGAHLREGVRLATQAGDNSTLGRALLNLSEIVAATDPAGAADAARTAREHMRRVGHRLGLSAATCNLADALLQLGDWDAAEAELTGVVDTEEPTSSEELTCEWAWLTALRGDAGAAAAALAGLREMRTSEAPQDKASIAMVEASIAAADGRPRDALRHAREVFGYREAFGINYTYVRWAWPLGVRSAFEVQDVAAVRELLAVLDSQQPGQLAPMLKAERELVRARLAALDGGVGGSGVGDGGGGGLALGMFSAAVGRLRELGTPYHLAHGLLDQAEFLGRRGDAAAAGVAAKEAREIGERLGCTVLVRRAEGMRAQVPPGS